MCCKHSVDVEKALRLADEIENHVVRRGGTKIENGFWTKALEAASIIRNMCSNCQCNKGNENGRGCGNSDNSHANVQP